MTNGATYRLLDTPIEFLKGVGPARAELLQKELGFFRFGDLLQHYPFRYVDRTKFYQVKDITSDSQLIQLKGVIDNLQTIGEKRRKRLTARFTDESGSMELVWFQGIKWIINALVPGQQYILFGKPNFFKGQINMPHPDVEPLTTANSQTRAALQPMYSSTEKLRVRGLDSKGIYRLTQALFDKIAPHDLPEMLPTALREKYKLVSRYDALRMIHLPKSAREVRAAQRRLKFEELFLLQLSVIKMKLGRHAQHKGVIMESLDRYFNPFYHKHLGFDLTTAQKRVLKEIRKDLLSGHQMNRLLQGDVGSGKTIVALMSMLMSIDNGYQAALMAPTEILAQQHYKGISEQLAPLGLRVAILTGSVKGAQRRQLFEALAQGDLHILIGTHALIEEKVQYHDLGLVVIDEQHRFGVAQRAKLWRKGTSHPPHVLVMTATPIPRTLAMTVFGDLDVSVIDELPPGRKPVTTHHMRDGDRLRIFGFMKKQIAEGRQVYVVYPLIQESEKLDLKDLQDGYESISRAFPLPDYAVSIVHGKMTPEDKAYEMQRFVRGETQIMVATTVIEVGVNVPNATVMVIENAERFGLAQLHQLRGRVGRGADQSFCLLVTKDKLSNDGRKRIRTMCETNDGFRIAEVDMELRGPGEMEGTRQSGRLNLIMADLTTDGPVLEEARKSALTLLDHDPNLQAPDNAGLRHYLVQQKQKAGFDWSRVL